MIAHPRVESVGVTYEDERRRSTVTNWAIGKICTVVSQLSISGPQDQLLLHEAYEAKLDSYRGERLRFYLSILPPIAGMALAFGAYTLLRAIARRLAR